MTINSEAFWRRVDDLLFIKKISFKQLCIDNKLGYSTLINQKNVYHRVPKLDQALLISQQLGVSLEYLLTGKENDSFPISILDIVQRLSSASLEEQNAVRRFLSIPEKRGNSEKQESTVI